MNYVVGWARDLVKKIRIGPFRKLDQGLPPDSENHVYEANARIKIAGKDAEGKRFDVEHVRWALDEASRKFPWMYGTRANQCNPWTRCEFWVEKDEPNDSSITFTSGVCDVPYLTAEELPKFRNYIEKLCRSVAELHLPRVASVYGEVNLKERVGSFSPEFRSRD
jgi:hypothetical protein